MRELLSISVVLLFLISCGSSSTSNIAPTANAGADQVVDEGTEVSLTGSGTDSDGTIEHYNWTQTSGKEVMLSGAETQNAEFTSPYVEQEEILMFELTVIDNEGGQATDTITVTINNNDLQKPTPLRDPKFVFGDKVSEQNQQEFKETAYFAMRFIRDETDIVLSKDLTYYIFADRENFITAYIQFHNQPESKRAEYRQILEERKNTFGHDWWGTFDDTAIFIYGERYFSIDGLERERLLVIAHEHYHAIQTLGQIGSDDIRHLGPEWLVEGSARYVEKRTLQRANLPLGDYGKERAKIIASNFDESLNDLETVGAFFSPDRPSFPAYVLGALAAEFLADNYGSLQAITQFYRLIDESTIWEEAFEDTFQIAIDEFYQEFEDYRTENFPPR